MRTDSASMVDIAEDRPRRGGCKFEDAITAMTDDERMSMQIRLRDIERAAANLRHAIDKHSKKQ
jgi:hypothetical protein